MSKKPFDASKLVIGRETGLLTIRIPKGIEDEFLTFLDFAQAQFTDEEIETFTNKEQQLMKFIDQILGNQRSYRFKTDQEKKQEVERVMAFSGVEVK